MYKTNNVISPGAKSQVTVLYSSFGLLNEVT